MNHEDSKTLRSTKNTGLSSRNLSSLFISFVIILSCNNKTSDSGPFEDVLSKSPFTGLTDSIKNDPKNDSLYFKRGILLNTNNLQEPALADFRTAWSLSKHEEYAFGLGRLLLEKKPDSAILFLRSVIKDLPNSFLLPLTLSRALLAEGNMDESLSIANELLARNPQQVDVLKLKADILEKKGDHNGSISTLETAYQLTPGDIELNYMLAIRLAETGNKKVIALCDSLIKADSLGIHAEPYYYKGIYYSSINDKQNALSFFDQAIKRDYNFLEGYIEKGALLFEQKKYPEALAVFNLCLTVSPKFADAYYWIAKCQEQMGKKAEARLNYERAYSLDNNLTEAKAAADKLK